MDESMRVPLPIGQGPDRTFEQYKAEKAQQTTSSEATGAAFDLAMPDTVTMLAARGYANYQAKQSGATDLSPEQANERYPEMPTPFREPVNPYVAQMLSDREGEKRVLQNKIANGPDDSWSKTKMFGAGVMAHLMDPAELAGGMLIGAAVGGVAASGALGARIAGVTAAASAPGAGIGLRLGVTAAEQGVGNLVQNTGQEALQAGVEGREGLLSNRSTGETAIDIGVGTVAGTIFGTVISEGARAAGGLARESIRESAARARAGRTVFHPDAIIHPQEGIIDVGPLAPEPAPMVKEARALLSTSPEADLPVMRNIVQAAETDIRPNIRPLLDTLAKETSVDLPPGNPTGVTYEFSPVTPEGVKSGKFFAATKDAVPNVASGELVHMGDDYGFGTHITDHPGVANAAAARSMADAPGMVHEVQITGELNPLPVGLRAPEGTPLAEGLTEILGRAEEDAAELVQGLPIKRVMELIRDRVDEGHLEPEALAELQDLIKKQGYNALIDDGASRLGVEHAQHNHITLLDDGLITEKGPRVPDERMVRVPDEREIKAQQDYMQDPQSKFGMNKEAHEDMRALIEQFKSESKADLAKLTKSIDENLAEVDDLAKQGFYGEEEAAAIRKRVMESRVLAEQEHMALKAFKACAGM